MMGLPPDETPPRMTADTPKPVIVNDPSKAMAENANNASGIDKPHGLKRIFKGLWRK
jgi:hypothetical protein